MKQQRGTPTKFKNVRGLKKLFEDFSTSSPTKQGIELLFQSNRTNLNLSTTTRSSRPGPNICAGQWEGGTRTGPRQDGGLMPQLDQDWPSQARLGAEGPIGRKMTGEMQERLQKEESS